MNVHVPVLLMIGFVCMAADAGEEPRVRTNFRPKAVLSKRQLRQVIALAHKCGVSEVTEVYTYNIHPSPSYGIGVNTIEVTNGRTATSFTVLIDSTKWVRKEDPEEVLASNGRFWVSRGGVITNKLTTFTAGNRSARFRLNDIDLAMADRIFALLAAGKVRYVDDQMKAELREIDLCAPVALYRSLEPESGGISISYRPFPSASLVLECVLQGGDIIVRRVSKGVS